MQARKSEQRYAKVVILVFFARVNNQESQESGLLRQNDLPVLYLGILDPVLSNLIRFFSKRAEGARAQSSKKSDNSGQISLKTSLTQAVERA